MAKTIFCNALAERVEEFGGGCGLEYSLQEGFTAQVTSKDMMGVMYAAASWGLQLKYDYLLPMYSFDRENMDRIYKVLSRVQRRSDERKLQVPSEDGMET